MTTCEPTDDLGLSPEFLADEDIARDTDEDSWRCKSKCGGPIYESGGQIGCPGCRLCFPPDHEAKPYGFGIERFEDPALTEANRAVTERMNGQYGAYSLSVHGHSRNGSVWPAFKPMRDALWALLSRHSAKRLRHSEIVWNRLCDECATHTDAVAAYQEWATRAVAVQYRDER